MKKRLLTGFILFFVALAANAQAVYDSVFMGAQYGNQIWYSLANDEQGGALKSNWDIAFETNGFASSVLLNTVTGCELWVYPNGDTTSWGTLDTAGITGWTKLYNSDTSWEVGAFNANVDGSDPYDLGWGVYNLNTHFVTGDSLYVIKLADGSYRKLWIVRLANSAYEFKYAGLDGSGEASKSIVKTNYSGKNFGYFSLQNGVEVDREPLSANWDITFTQYTTFIPQAYPVTGILSNKGIQVAEAFPVNNKATYVDYTSHTFETAINTIGYDWKTFNNTTFMYELKDSLVYFIKDQNEDIWKVIFTGFGGSSTGKFVFSKENLTDNSNGIFGPSQKQNFFTVYPNPANAGNVNVVMDAPAAANGVITITDIQGKTIATQNLDVVGGLATYSLSTQDFNTGVYFVKVEAGNSVQTQKLIITN